jgi:hypothetical protein
MTTEKARTNSPVRFPKSDPQTCGLKFRDDQALAAPELQTFGDYR